MLMNLENKKIFIASQPIDFRMSIDSLSTMIQNNKKTYLHDGSIYVFYNRFHDKIKCLFWDKNGFVLYYKRLDRCKFKFDKMPKDLTSLTPEQLETILAGYDPSKAQKYESKLIEHQE